jgi:hypothetical protein
MTVDHRRQENKKLTLGLNIQVRQIHITWNKVIISRNSEFLATVISSKRNEKKRKRNENMQS